MLVSHIRDSATLTLRALRLIWGNVATRKTVGLASGSTSLVLVTVWLALHALCPASSGLIETHTTDFTTAYTSLIVEAPKRTGLTLGSV